MSVRGRYGRGSSAVVAVVATVAALGLAAGVVPTLPDLNPFDTETRDRSQPALLRSLQRLSEYRAARANLQQIVDVEQDAGLLPAFVKGERRLVAVAGTVDAAVDFRRLDPRALQVSPDRRAVTITLPPAELRPARVDLARTRVVDHERGLVDRAGDMLSSGGADEERQLLLLAERKLDAAARSDPDLLRTAESNTAEMLERLGHGLGFDRVTVRFARSPV